MGRRDSPARRVAFGVALATLGASLAACAGAGRAGGPRPDAAAYDFQVGYYISCSISDECRVQYIDEAGVLRAKDIVGEWKMDFGADSGTRLWLRAGAGGCPPKAVRAEIRMGADVVAEHIARPPRGQRCRWILAETEFRVP